MQAALAEKRLQPAECFAPRTPRQIKYRLCQLRRPDAGEFPAALHMESCGIELRNWLGKRYFFDACQKI
jgi:hypothetical protein